MQAHATNDAIQPAWNDEGVEGRRGRRVEGEGGRRGRGGERRKERGRIKPMIGAHICYAAMT